jgi:ADP-ribose pyrophosphatase YjhB (NUDIX family)
MLEQQGITLGCITQYKLGPFGLQGEMRLAQRLGCRTMVTGAVGPKGLSGAELKSAVARFAEKMKPHLAVAEETGVTIVVGRLIGVYSDPARMVVEYPDGQRVHVVNLCFEARPIGRGTATTPDEALASGYFALEALPDPLVPIHRVRIEDAVAGAADVRVR